MPAVELAAVEDATSAEAAKKVESGTPIIGIIYPPPDVRNILDKTAAFVARNGFKFEDRIRENEKANPKFGFLNPTDPYHAYYQFKIKEIQEGRASAKDDKKDDKPEEVAQPAKPPPKEPPAFEFMADQPQISAQDLDVLKLTAQFVARNGRSFLTGLSQREARNYQFDFLRQNHSLFSYFTRLVEQYTKVLIPQKHTIDVLLEVGDSKYKILDRVMQRVEWEEYQSKQRKQADENVEAERAAFSAVEWHDFVIVGAIEFKPEDDEMSLPPPLTYESLVGRTLVQKKAAALLAIPDERQPSGEDDMEVEMDAEMDKEEVPVPAAPIVDEANMRIKKDYVPRSVLAEKARPENPTFTFRGQTLSDKEVDKHMRIELLDPKWKEQREAALQKTKDSNLAPDSDISRNLQQFAKRRTDIFGREETEIGRKIGEDEDQTKHMQQIKEQTAWDGHVSSINSTRASLQSTPAIPQEIDYRAVGPQAPVSSSAQFRPLPPQPVRAPLPLPTPVVQQAPIPTPAYPAFFQPPAPPPPMMMPMFGGYPPAMHPGMPFTPQFGFMPTEEDDPNKRQRTDDVLIPEQVFLESHPPNVLVRVGVPQQAAQDKSAGALNGQVENFDMALTQTVGQLKEAIQQRIGVPAAKMNLRHMLFGFLKDQYTLAYYNFVYGIELQMLLRERGGRKK